MNTYPIYAAGRFITTSDKLNVHCSHDNEPIAKTFLANKEILEECINKALAVKEELASLPAYEKYEILMEIANEMKLQKDHLATILASEASKPIKYAHAEIARAISTFIAAAEEAKRPPMEYMRLDWEHSGRSREGLVRYFPIGLVSGISPFNFPMNLTVHKIAPALAAGCPIILKPASSTPLSNLELAKIVDKTALPKGALSILPMDRNTGNVLVTDERFKLLTFTGSPTVGWKMKNDAGKKKVVLELGGNAGAIITASCDIEHAVKRCLVGAFAYAGQVCIHAQRLYVHASVFNIFREKFISGTNKLKTGHPLDPETDIASMIDEDNAIRVEKWVNEAIGDGARLLTGGHRSGAFVGPTILENIKNTMKVSCMEVFGPVVTIESYNHFSEAVDKVNDSVYGLQAGVFTNNIEEMNYAFSKLEVGGVIINDIPTFRVDHMPYGGVKDSGLGREGVKYAMMDMLEPKILVKNFV
jgi:acyl-CoA reductase-like NAD-dependent aldehyde dehydrogenase